MLRTLGTLVVSMTGTAALLNWVAPSASAPKADMPAEVAIAQARTAVATESAAGLALWSRIELEGATSDTPGARALTATADEPGVHFTIDASGRCYSSDSWRTQAFTAGSSAEIHIRLLQGSIGEPMSQSQWTAVRAIVSELDARLGAEAGDGLPVFLEPDLAAVYGLASDVSIHVPTLQ